MKVERTGKSIYIEYVLDTNYKAAILIMRMKQFQWEQAILLEAAGEL